MQKFAIKQRAEAAPSKNTPHPDFQTARLSRGRERSKFKGFETRSAAKMETPTPISNEDRRKMHAPLDKSAETIWPNLNSFIAASSADSRSETEGSGDIVHRESPAPLARTEPMGIIRKRIMPSASRDEWAASSDDEAISPASKSNTIITSNYFQSEPGKQLNNAPAKKKGKPGILHPLSDPKKETRAGRTLSMSKTAVDFRERHKQADAWKEKVCAFIDNDILEAVDKEGGMTPPGRTYKAVYRMMVRWKCSTQPPMTPPDSNEDSSPDEVAKLKAENQMLKRRMEQATKLLGPVASGETSVP